MVELHIVDGDSPTLRLEQDGSSGFTPQTWDIAGNETNFFIRDVTGGSKLPFKIKPGAPNNSIFIAADGDVGIETASPAANLHVVEGAAGVPTIFRTTSNGNSLWEVHDTGSDEVFRFNWAQSIDDLNLVHLTGGPSGTVGTNNFRFSFNDGNLTIDGDVITGNCPTGCGPADFVFEPDYELMELDEFGTYVRENRHLPNIPSAEEMNEGVRLTWMQMRLLEKIEELTLYTIAQQEEISELRSVVETLRTE